MSDYDLNILSNLKNKLIRKTKFLISSTKVINICLNKIKTNNFLISNKFDTPKIFKKKKQIIKFPVVLKTVDGNGSKETDSAFFVIITSYLGNHLGKIFHRLDLLRSKIY